MTKSETDAAKLLGRKGGLSKSEAKAESSRQNGKLGGKPTDLAILAEVLDDYLRLVGPDPDRTRRIDIAWKFLRELVPAKDLPHTRQNGKKGGRPKGKLA